MLINVHFLNHKIHFWQIGLLVSQCWYWWWSEKLWSTPSSCLKIKQNYKGKTLRRLWGKMTDARWGHQLIGQANKTEWKKQVTFCFCSIQHPHTIDWTMESKDNISKYFVALQMGKTGIKESDRQLYSSCLLIKMERAFMG